MFILNKCQCIHVYELNKYAFGPKLGSFRYPILNVYIPSKQKSYFYAKDLITNMAVYITILHRNDINITQD